MTWAGKIQGNKKIILRFPVLNISMCSHVCILKRSVCNQLLCHLLLECWIQRVCCNEMMCEEQYRMRKRIRKHPRPSSPGEKACQAAVQFGRCSGTSAGEARAGLRKREGEIERDKTSIWSILGPQAASQHRQSYFDLGSENTLWMGGDGGSGAGVWWTGARGAGRLCQRAARMALLSQHGHVCRAAGQKPALAPPHAAAACALARSWGSLVDGAQVPRRLSRKSCLKWKQSLQPGGMPCGEVSRHWLSQENMHQFGI